MQHIKQICNLHYLLILNKYNFKAFSTFLVQISLWLPNWDIFIKYSCWRGSNSYLSFCMDDLHGRLPSFTWYRIWKLGNRFYSLSYPTFHHHVLPLPLFILNCLLYIHLHRQDNISFWKLKMIISIHFWGTGK